MEMTTATYSGRFMRPSIFRQATPIRLSSWMCPAMDMSFRDRGLPSALPFQPYLRRQGWAHNPRLPDRPPIMEDMKHWPE